MDITPTVLLENSFSGLNASGIIFSNRFILTTSQVFNNVELNNLVRNTSLNFNTLTNCSRINNLKLTVITADKGEQNIFEAEPLFYFTCSHLHKSLNAEIKDWSLSEINSLNEINNSREPNNNLTQIKNLSIFFILEKLDNQFPAHKVLLQTHLANFLETCSKEYLIGDEIRIICTPFGLRHFLNSCSKGIVSNKFGIESNLLLVDYPGVPGCEGGSIFSLYRSHLVAIILCCIRSWKDSSVGLIVAVNLHSLLTPLLVHDHENLNKQIENRKQILTTKYFKQQFPYNSLAQLICGSSWGTAILLNKPKGIFITAAHVVEGPSIKLLWNSQNFDAEVIYSTPPDKIYDLAICKVTSKSFFSSKMEQISITKRIPKVSDCVYAAGYSMFSQKYNPKPILTKGIISKKLTSLLHTSCTVLAGTSGGALLDEDFKLVGVIIANISLENVKYPKINMAVPISAIYNILDVYFRTNDERTLEALCTKDGSLKKEWNILSYSKL